MPMQYLPHGMGVPHPQMQMHPQMAMGMPMQMMQMHPMQMGMQMGMPMGMPMGMSMGMHLGPHQQPHFQGMPYPIPILPHPMMAGAGGVPGGPNPGAFPGAGSGGSGGSAGGANPMGAAMMPTQYRNIAPDRITAALNAATATGDAEVERTVRKHYLVFLFLLSTWPTDFCLCVFVSLRSFLLFLICCSSLLVLALKAL
jgi:hypothetical protein